MSCKQVYQFLLSRVIRTCDKHRVNDMFIFGIFSNQFLVIPVKHARRRVRFLIVPAGSRPHCTIQQLCNLGLTFTKQLNIETYEKLLTMKTFFHKNDFLWNWNNSLNQCENWTWKHLWHLSFIIHSTFRS